MSEKMKRKLDESEIETLVAALSEAAALHRMLVAASSPVPGIGVSVDETWHGFMADRYEELAALANSVQITGITVRYYVPDWAGA